MRNNHEPNDEFITRLEGVVIAENRRRAALSPRASWVGWLVQSPLRAAAVALTLAVASMAIGGGIVAAAYESQANEQRDSLLAVYVGKDAIAKQHLVIARDALSTAQQRVSIGIEGQDAVIDAQFKVREAEAQIKAIDLQIQEVRATGREPVRTASAPLVSGRDFVAEGWRIDMGVPQQALEAARYALSAAQQRFSIGIANGTDVQAARARVLELEAAIVGCQKKLEIRQRFVSHDVDAALADLLMLENDARQRQQVLAPRIELARMTVSDLQTKVSVGAAGQPDLAQAQVELQELQLEATKANLDLAVVQRQIQQYRIKK